jgi:hypothetical protein
MGGRWTYRINVDPGNNEKQQATAEQIAVKA